MKNLNLAIIIGKVTRKKTSTTGTPRLNVQVQVTTEYYKDGEKKLFNDTINCVLWGKKVDKADREINVGDVVLAKGQIKNRSYDNNGQKVWVTEVNCDEIGIMSGSGSAGSSSDVVGDDDLPF